MNLKREQNLLGSIILMRVILNGKNENGAPETKVDVGSNMTENQVTSLVVVLVL